MSVAIWAFFMGTVLGVLIGFGVGWIRGCEFTADQKIISDLNKPTAPWRR